MFIIIITILVLLQPATDDINYELIQVIIGVMVLIVTGVWALFSYLNNLRSKHTEKVQSQNHEILVEQEKKVEELRDMIVAMKEPFNQKIESRKKKDVDQDRQIQVNEKEIEKLQLRMESVEKEIEDFKVTFNKRFDKFETLVVNLAKK